MWLAVGEGSWAGVLGDAHADGARVAVEPRDCEPGSVVWSAERDLVGRLIVRTRAEVGTAAARAWFVHLSQARSDGRPAHVLVAFDAPVVAAGTVLDRAAFTPLPVRNDEQLGAVRFDAVLGIIEELSVRADCRGQGLASTLSYVAGAVQRVVIDGPPLRAGGPRTDAGEAFASSMAATGRVGPRTAISRLDSR